MTWMLLGAAALAQQPAPAPADGAAVELPLDLEAKIHGYGQVGASVKTQNHPLGVEIGDVVLAFTAALDKAVSIDVDALFGLDQDGDWLAIADRVEIDTRLTEGLHVTAGKFYLPFGWWNANLPYGGWLYPTVDRPMMLAFERHGAAIPVHQAGADIHGVALAGYWQLGAHLGIGNGRSPHLTRTQDIGDGGLGKAVWAQLYVESPGKVQLGVSGYYDDRVQVGHLAMDLSEDFGDVSDTYMAEHVHHDEVVLQHDTREAIAGAHLAWSGSRTQLLAEGAVVMHQRARVDGIAPPEIPEAPPEAKPYDPQVNWDGYVQLSHKIKRVTPYGRVDYVEFWQYDPMYWDMGRIRLSGVASAGARIDGADHAAVKLEASAQRDVVFAQVGKNGRVSHRFGAGAFLVAGF